MEPSSTIGEFFHTLCEMGFSEAQIQTAMQAGHFSVPEAAEWLLQGGSPRHKLVRHSPQPTETAFSAFNPPKRQEMPNKVQIPQPHHEDSAQGTLVWTDAETSADKPLKGYQPSNVSLT
ncbi:uncharacterized protein LOC108942405 [Arapaima gigas]